MAMDLRLVLGVIGLPACPNCGSETPRVCIRSRLADGTASYRCEGCGVESVRYLASADRRRQNPGDLPRKHGPARNREATPT